MRNKANNPSRSSTAARNAIARPTKITPVPRNGRRTSRRIRYRSPANPGSGMSFQRNGTRTICSTDENVRVTKSPGKVAASIARYRPDAASYSGEQYSTCPVSGWILLANPVVIAYTTLSEYACPNEYGPGVIMSDSLYGSVRPRSPACHWQPPPRRTAEITGHDTATNTVRHTAADANFNDRCRRQPPPTNANNTQKNTGISTRKSVRNP